MEKIDTSAERVEARAAVCDLSPMEFDKETGATLRALLRERDAARAEVARLRAIIAPFAEAAENLDDWHRDSSPIWESAAAMEIDAKHLRCARAALAGEGRKDG